ncbi:MAG TPA: universal stress protein [Gaiellaceae bacterium]|jgi:nucleotide-binding universal stress UspA family protein
MTALMPVDNRTLLLDAERKRLPTAPVLAAVDNSRASEAAVGDAVALAQELEAPLVFAYVRRGPSGVLGAPFYQRRLSKEMQRARRALARALRAAELGGVEAEGEILEGSPRRRILGLARDRGAQLVVVGSRRRRLGPSVSRAVTRAADRPVMVSGGRVAGA